MRIVFGNDAERTVDKCVGGKLIEAGIAKKKEEKKS
jgi:hypothetical protein